MLMDSSLWFDKLGIVLCTYLGVSGYNFKNILYFLSEDFFNLTNSVDPDEMPYDYIGVSRCL